MLKGTPATLNRIRQQPRFKHPWNLAVQTADVHTTDDDPRLSLSWETKEPVRTAQDYIIGMRDQLLNDPQVLGCMSTDYHSFTVDQRADSGYRIAFRIPHSNPFDE